MNFIHNIRLYLNRVQRFAGMRSEKQVYFKKKLEFGNERAPWILILKQEGQSLVVNTIECEEIPHFRKFSVRP